MKGSGEVTFSNTNGFQCAGCTTRFVGCHGVCPTYIKAAEEQANRRASIRNSKQVEVEYIDTVLAGKYKWKRSHR
jgi:hypothetical protein